MVDRGDIALAQEFWEVYKEVARRGAELAPFEKRLRELYNIDGPIKGFMVDNHNHRLYITINDKQVIFPLSPRRRGPLELPEFFIERGQ